MSLLKLLVTSGLRVAGEVLDNGGYEGAGDYLNGIADLTYSKKQDVTPYYNNSNIVYDEYEEYYEEYYEEVTTTVTTVVTEYNSGYSVKSDMKEIDSSRSDSQIGLDVIGLLNKHYSSDNYSNKNKKKRNKDYSDCNVKPVRRLFKNK